MDNIFLKNKKSIKEYHYAIKSRHYDNGSQWVGFNANKINDYNRLHKGNFCVIVYGDSDDARDFYAIPFERISAYFNTATYDRTQNRWVVHIVNGSIDFAGQISKDIHDCYGNTENLKINVPKPVWETWIKQ
jgi:hypothetical protein